MPCNAREPHSRRIPAASRERSPLPRSPQERELTGRFADAVEKGDIDRLVSVLSDDAWVTLPPYPFGHQGHEAIARPYRLMMLTLDGTGSPRSRGSPTAGYSLDLVSLGRCLRSRFRKPLRTHLSRPKRPNSGTVSPPGIIPGIFGLLMREAGEASRETTLVNDRSLFHLTECVVGLLGSICKSRSNWVHQTSPFLESLHPTTTQPDFHSEDSRWPVAAPKLDSLPGRSSAPFPRTFVLVGAVCDTEYDNP